MEEDFSGWTGIERRVNPRENNIVVVSHAESIGNSEGIFQGQTFDSDLSELGKKQAKALAKRLKIFGARKIITSPLISNSDIDKMWEISLEAAALNFLEVNKVNQKNVFRVLKLNDTNHLVGLRNDVKKKHS